MNDKVNKKLLKLSGVCAIILAVALIVVGVFELLVIHYKNKLEYLDAGKRWSADGERYAVINMYAEEGSAVSSDQALSWANSMDSSLLKSSVTPNEGARSWAYTYAADVTVSVTGPKSTVTAEAIAAGGDFFVFHPMKIVYGSYFLNDDSNPLGIVIDRNLAWKLFGAENIVGMTVTINGEEFVVTGITEPETDKGIYGYTYGTRPRMYMSYAGYIKTVGEDNSVTIFETALPNAVKSFAKNIFDGVVKVNEETTEVIEVTDRFSLQNRFNNMKTLKYSWIRADKIEYPYWENEAKVYDYYCAIFMIFEVAMAALFVVSLLIALVSIRFSGYSVIYDLKKLFDKAEKSYKKKHPKKVKKTVNDKSL